MNESMNDEETAEAVASRLLSERKVYIGDVVQLHMPNGDTRTRVVLSQDVADIWNNSRKVQDMENTTFTIVRGQHGR